jgi:Fur family transcriptional regulator, peroxide stress response regulator
MTMVPSTDRRFSSPAPCTTYLDIHCNENYSYSVIHPKEIAMNDSAFDSSTDLRNILAAAGFKATQQRLEVFRAIRCLHDHPTVLEVFGKVRESLPTISIDTVYRTLWTLSGMGLVNPVATHGEAVRFDADIRPHHHFICTSCGLMLDFRNSGLDCLEIPDEARALGAVDGYLVEVRGICNDCLDSEHGKGPDGPEKGARNV